MSIDRHIQRWHFTLGRLRQETNKGVAFQLGGKAILRLGRPLRLHGQNHACFGEQDAHPISCQSLLAPGTAASSY